MISGTRKPGKEAISRQVAPCSYNLGSITILGIGNIFVFGRQQFLKCPIPMARYFMEMLTMFGPFILISASMKRGFIKMLIIGNTGILGKVIASDV